MTFSKKNIEHIKKNRFHLSKINNIIIIVLLLFAVGINAQIRPVDVDKIVEAEMIRQNLPGLAIGVYKKGTINYLKGYGYIDINNKKPITTNTVFRWASISKTLTAVAALQLDEKRDDFSINDTVFKLYSHWTSKNKFSGKYLDIPDKARKNEITIKQLLTHRSGINHYGKGASHNYESDSDYFNANSSVDVFRNMVLISNPGSKYKYTTYGYNLLGAVVDKVSGSYPKWVEKNIKNKLGMSSLKIATRKGVPIGFQKPKDGIITQAKNYSKESVLPGGGWESNIKDLMKFAKGILDERLLKNTSDLWRDDGYKTKDKNDKDEPQEYRRGINSSGSMNSRRVYHGGSHSNIRTLMYIMPKKDIAVVLMIPVEYVNRWNILNRIMDKLDVSRKVKTSPMDLCSDGMKSSKTKRFVGIWKKTNKDVVIRRGYNTINFKKEWSFLTSKGYHLEDIEVYYHKKKLVWDGIFKMGRGQYAMWRNYDYNGFKKKWDEMNNKGYRLYDLETYMVSGKRKWAGLFKKGSGKYAMWRNLSTENFSKKREVMAKQGMKLTDIEVFESKGQLKWSGVWTAGKNGLYFSNRDLSDFKKLMRKKSHEGYKLIDVETYKVRGKQKWSGVLEKVSQHHMYSYNSNYCDFMKKHDFYSSQGYELIDLESY